MDIAQRSEEEAAAPRHMRRRRFRRDVPDSMLPGITSSAQQNSVTDPAGRPDRPAAARVTKPAPAPMAARETKHQRKRAVALVIVILVSLTIPVLALTLIFAG